MKKALFQMALLCLVILASCRQGSELPQDYEARTCDELSRLGTKYFEAWANEDLDSLLFFLDPQYLNMFAYGPATNIEEDKISFRNIFDSYSVQDVKYERVECLVDNMMAFETGLFEQKWITNDSKDTIFFKMRGMTVWRKQADGNWKMLRLIAQQ